MNSDPHDMMAAYFEGKLNAEQVAELEQWLREDRERLRAWTREAMLQCHLAELLREQDLEHIAAEPSDDRPLGADDLAELVRMEAAAETITLPPPPAEAQAADDTDSFSPREFVAITGYALGLALKSKPAKKFYAYTGVAAVLALVVTLAIVFSSDETPVGEPFAGHDPNTPAASTQSTPRGSELLTVATLTATHNAQWDSTSAERASARGSDLRTGSKLHPNQRLTLTAGFAEITTAQGAIAIIEAPATIELTDNDNALQLHSGKLVGICETDSSKGFLVRTEHMDITDLGTEFGVNVADNQLTTTVFAGEVELTTPGQAPKPLVANQTATLDDGVGARVVVQERVAQGFTLRLPRVTTAEQVQSRATPIAAWDFFGFDTQAGVYSGDISTASGLQMTGFTGQWGTMPADQGAIEQPDRSFITGETTGVSNGITLRWAVDGVGATHWGWVQPGNNHPLFADYYFIRNPSRWGGAAIPWRIEGLNPGASYDIIFYGLDSPYHDGALIAINGHDAGNGVGAAATLDDENDADFQSVIADADGFISGTFNASEHGKEAAITGIQIGKLPAPGPSE